MYDGLYDWEQDDAEWENDSRIICVNCEARVRMTGHLFCWTCDREIIPAIANTGVLYLEELLSKNAPFSEWCVEHHRL